MQKDEIRERLVELLSEVQDCGCDVTDVVDMIYVENEAVADHMLANGVTVQEWIPDAEQTPEEDPETGYIDVVVLTEKRNVKIATWDGMNYYIEISKAEEIGDAVTHWMPLPEPPKEVE